MAINTDMNILIDSVLMKRVSKKIIIWAVINLPIVGNNGFCWDHFEVLDSSLKKARFTPSMKSKGIIIQTIEVFLNINKDKQPIPIL